MTVQAKRLTNLWAIRDKLYVIRHEALTAAEEWAIRKYREVEAVDIDNPDDRRALTAQAAAWTVTR